MQVRGAGGTVLGLPPQVLLTVTEQSLAMWPPDLSQASEVLSSRGRSWWGAAHLWPSPG